MTLRIRIPLPLAMSLLAFACDGGTSTDGDGGSGETGDDGSTVIEAPPLVINEFLAKNETTNTDANGEYEDWVEIYNAGSTIVQLDGFYLSDKKDEPTKFEMPAGQCIEAGGFLLVWCDGDGVEDANGDIHTNFSLNKDGEVLYLMYVEGDGMGQADAVQWKADQAPDVSAARVPDGESHWVNTTPTPGASNGV